MTCFEVHVMGGSELMPLASPIKFEDRDEATFYMELEQTSGDTLRIELWNSETRERLEAWQYSGPQRGIGGSWVLEN